MISHTIIILTLATCCSHNDATATVLKQSSKEGTAQKEPSNSNSTLINLPNGFDSEMPPIRPLLYPFATEDPTVTTSGWKPIINTITSEQPHSMSDVPKLEDRMSESSDEEVMVPVTPAIESVVYGVWKPEPPLKPMKMLNFTYAEGFSAVNFTTLKEEDKINTSKPAQVTDIQSNIKIIKVNVSDPVLLERAKQINDSLDRTEYINQHIKSFQRSSSISKKTVIAKEELQQQQQQQQQQLRNALLTPLMNPINVNFMDNTSSSTTPPPQPYETTMKMYESLHPLQPFNITKLGVPYEQQNSKEESTICVPLTIREQSTNGKIGKYQNVERVYCFPLPSSSSSSPSSSSSSASMSSSPPSLAPTRVQLANESRRIDVVRNTTHHYVIKSSADVQVNVMNYLFILHLFFCFAIKSFLEYS